jgi:hypothetical protein
MNFAKTGVMLYVKHYTKDVSEWQGPLTLADGTQLRLEGKAFAGRGYEVTVKNPSDGWKPVAAFKLDAFEGKSKQDVNVPGVGNLRAYIGRTKSADEWCIRFVVLDEKGRAPAPKPF